MPFLLFWEIANVYQIVIFQKELYFYIWFGYVMLDMIG